MPLHPAMPLHREMATDQGNPSSESSNQGGSNQGGSNQSGSNRVGSGQDVLETIAKLGDLRDKGFLSEDEFNSKKSDLLSRL